MKKICFNEYDIFICVPNGGGKKCSGYCVDLFCYFCCCCCCCIRMGNKLQQKCVSTAISTHKRYNVWAIKATLQSQILFIGLWPCTIGLPCQYNTTAIVVCDRCTFVARIGHPRTPFRQTVASSFFIIFFFSLFFFF